jgi:hypothetical protein
LFFDLSQQIHAIAARHLHVCDQQVTGLPRQVSQTVLCVRETAHVRADPFQGLLHDGADFRLIIHKHN